MGDREILETYLNSASKNTSETDIFPHGPKSLLTGVISDHFVNLEIYLSLTSHPESLLSALLLGQYILR